ncbi:hypothetical protein [Streptomyces jumonjinensis]|uniref:Uncharacterized protein n=1 Tax=Streptomyces jumonjinensis TaxID=1945 RepID=A0A646KNQ7_STRJU|nr:hypothetical protein [Streptomyces jumonjinensis]MQT03875.1 hypothetical protein [Streptomyces jumonjinensis]
MTTTDRTAPAERDHVPVALRRTAVAALLNAGISQRDIARLLGATQSVVSRDARAIRAQAAQAADQQKPAVGATLRERIAHRITTVDATMAQLDAAVTDIVAARPARAIVPPAVAHRWRRDLRERTASLTELETAFEECYPLSTTEGP